MVSTTPAGSRPMAVSSESITASVPSSTALATSVTSARVGMGFCTMDTSICVAVMTGRPARLAALMIRFWAAGTFSIGTSTPRSPRATMMPSETSRMASIRSSAGCFSILAMRGRLHSSRAARTSASLRT